MVNITKLVSLKFQQGQLLACEVPRVVSNASAKLNSLLITNHECLERPMTHLHKDGNNLHEEILMYRSITLDKPGRRCTEPIEHSAEVYEKYFTENAFEIIIAGTERYLEQRFEDFNKTPLKELVKVFNFKEWPKSFSGENRKWDLEEVKSATNYFVQHGFLETEEAASASDGSGACSEKK